MKPRLTIALCCLFLALVAFTATPGEAGLGSTITFKVANLVGADISVGLKITLPEGIVLATTQRMVEIPKGGMTDVIAKTGGCNIPADARFELNWIAKGMKARRESITGPADGSITAIAISMQGADRRHLGDPDTTYSGFAQSSVEFTIANKSKDPIHEKTYVLDAKGKIIGEERSVESGRGSLLDRIAPGKTGKAMVFADQGQVFPTNARFRCVITSLNGGLLKIIDGSLTDSRTIVYQPTSTTEKPRPETRPGSSEATFSLVNQGKQEVVVTLGIGLNSLTKVNSPSGNVSGPVLAIQKNIRISPQKNTQVTLKSDSGDPFPSGAFFYALIPIEAPKDKGVLVRRDHLFDIVIGDLERDSRTILLGLQETTPPTSSGRDQKGRLDMPEASGGCYKNAGFAITNHLGEVVDVRIEIFVEGTRLLAWPQQTGTPKEGSRDVYSESTIGIGKAKWIVVASPDGRVFPENATWRITASKLARADKDRTGYSESCLFWTSGKLMNGAQEVAMKRPELPDSTHRKGDPITALQSKKASFQIANRFRETMRGTIYVGIQGLTTLSVPTGRTSGADLYQHQVSGPILGSARFELAGGGQTAIEVESKEAIIQPEECCFICVCSGKGGGVAVMGRLVSTPPVINLGPVPVNDQKGDGKMPSLESQVTFTLSNSTSQTIETHLSILDPNGATIATEKMPMGGKSGTRDQFAGNSLLPGKSRTVTLANPSFEVFPGNSTWRCVVSKQGVVTRILTGRLYQDSRIIAIASSDTGNTGSGQTGAKDEARDGKLPTELTMQINSTVAKPCSLTGELLSGNSSLGKASVSVPAFGSARITFSNVHGGIPANADYSFIGRCDDPAGVPGRTFKITGNLERSGSIVTITQSNLPR